MSTAFVLIEAKNYRTFLNFNETAQLSEGFLKWLKESGFFTAPASVSHHGSKTGGLFEHSCAVAKILKDYTEKLGLEWDREISPWIVGMFHDLCKTDDYSYNRDEGKWEWNKNQIHNGHGAKSVLMLQQHMELNEQEIACIRWHMGAFTDQKEWEYYGRAVEKHPTVLYTHTADMYASRVWGV